MGLINISSFYGVNHFMVFSLAYRRSDCLDSNWSFIEITIRVISIIYGPDYPAAAHLTNGSLLARYYR
jgi:hypothetical protein